MAKTVVVIVTSTTSGVIGLTENELKSLCAFVKEGDTYYIGRYGTNKTSLRKKYVGKK